MTSQSATALPTATRRVRLRFDEKGDPAFASVKSPECFKQHARGVLPPPDVIPVIFVPGVMGSNICQKDGSEKVWSPPNSAVSGVWAGITGGFWSAKKRHVVFDPDNTEVDPTGPCPISPYNYWIDEGEAKRRMWGALHADSYHSFMARLEEQLNDQYVNPGAQEVHLISQLGMLEYLGGGPSKTENYRAHAWQTMPDYATFAQKAVNAWGAQPKALSKGEIKRVGDYYYPVWAFGYNWLRSNEEAANELIEYINTEVLKRYEGKYFRHQGKVILITHSMGGLVGRRAAQIAPDKILGVIHGAQPVMGAPVLYRRFRSGMEIDGFFDIPGRVFAGIAGGTEEKVAAQIACAPGPLELAPTCDYPPHWLKIAFKTRTIHKGSGIFNPSVKQAGDVIFTAPERNPYLEIYSKTTDKCWWGLAHPENLDPSERLKGDNLDPVKVFKKAVTDAESFHGTLKRHAHPMTYGFYGNDDNKHRTFGHVTWHVPELERCTLRPSELPHLRAVGYGSGTVKLPIPSYDGSKDSVVTKPVEVKLSNERNQSGDGTVPFDSGTWLEKLEPKPQEVLAFPGFDHQGAFSYRYAAEATVYFLARIIQKAKPPVS